MSNPGVSRTQALEVLAAYEQCKQNKAAAARLLGMQPSTFRNRLDRAYEMFPEKMSGGADDRPSFPELQDPDVPVTDIIQSMSKRFQRRHAHEQARRWLDIKVPIEGPFAVAWVGDPHLDSNGCNWPLLLEHVELLSENREFAYAFSAGDALDNWPKNGRMTQLYAESDQSEGTAWRLAEWFLEGANINWLGWLLGNHDLWNNGNQVFKRLGMQRVPMFEWGAKFRIVPPQGKPYRIWASHDFPGRSIWNSLHGPGRAAQTQEEADLLICGHTHNWALHSEESGARGHIYDIVRARGYKYIDDYAEKLGHFPQRFGASVVTVFCPEAEDIGRMQTFRDPHMAIDFCRYLRTKHGF